MSEPVVWEDLPSTATPLNAATLNQMQTYVGEQAALAETARTEAQQAAADATAPTDSIIANALNTLGSQSRIAADGLYGFAYNIESYGAVGDGTTDDTAAIQAAITAAAADGATLWVPAGKTYKCLTPLTLTSGSFIHLGGTLNFSEATAVSTGYITATGTEATAVNATANITANTTTISVPSGHGITAENLIRVCSDGIYDASSTSSKVGELIEVASVTSTSITTKTPLMGSYTTANTARVSKITPVERIRIVGNGRLQGARDNLKGEYGIVIRYGRDVVIEGIRSDGFDNRHVFLPDCINTHVRNCRITWSQSNNGYGVSFCNAAQDCSAVGNRFDYCRHSLSTNNESAFPGVTRRIRFQSNTITNSAPANTGAGGDAIDTHTAAEQIWVEDNTVIGSSSQGINFECRSGSVSRNRIWGTASNGISVHNESDLYGVVRVCDNEVRNATGIGVYVIAGIRGTAAVYESLDVSGNTVFDCSGIGIRVGISTATNLARDITVARNRVMRAGAAGLTVERADGVSVTGNSLWDCVQGFVVNNVAHFTYDGNISRNSTLGATNYIAHSFIQASYGTTSAVGGRAAGSGSVGIQFANDCSNITIGTYRINAATQLTKGAGTGILEVTTA